MSNPEELKRQIAVSTASFQRYETARLFAQRPAEVPTILKLQAVQHESEIEIKAEA